MFTFGYKTKTLINYTDGIHRTCVHTLLSFVTMSTRTDWSKEAHTHRPCLSGLQSRLAMGCVERVTFCRRLTVPATPMSFPSPSCSLLLAGYSLSQIIHYMILDHKIIFVPLKMAYAVQ